VSTAAIAPTVAAAPVTAASVAITSTVVSTTTLAIALDKTPAIAHPSNVLLDEPTLATSGLPAPLLSDPPTEVVITEATIVPIAPPADAPAASGAASSAATASNDTRRQLRDADIAYAVRVAHFEVLTSCLSFHLCMIQYFIELKENEERMLRWWFKSGIYINTNVHKTQNCIFIKHDSLHKDHLQLY